MREAVRGAARELLELEPRPDALVCCNDPSALAALAELRAAGVRVPDEVAVIGFDDVPEASLSSPRLTTVRQPMIQMGREAACMLLERMLEGNRHDENANYGNGGGGYLPQGGGGDAGYNQAASDLENRPFDFGQGGNDWSDGGGGGGGDFSSGSSDDGGGW